MAALPSWQPFFVHLCCRDESVTFYPDYDYKEKEDDVLYVAIMMMTIKMRKGSK